MARKQKHEEHTNHEAWAIPYGDLVTLLLALFVVMYSMSAINEGKFRVLSDSLNAAFGGPPRSPSPIQIGPKASGAGASSPRPQILPGAPSQPGMRGAALAAKKPDVAGPVVAKLAGDQTRGSPIRARERAELQRIGDEIHDALGDLIAQNMVIVRRHESWLEVEIQTDILFVSGSAQIGQDARPVLDRLATVLKGFGNRMRIEGHTDDRPISTREFPSNWELSSARAASVVHRMMAQGVDPRRMTVLGLAEYQPVADNVAEAGRNRNRRVVLVVMANPSDPALPSPLPAQAAGSIEPAAPAAPAEPAQAAQAAADPLELRAPAASAAVNLAINRGFAQP